MLREKRSATVFSDDTLVLSTQERGLLISARLQHCRAVHYYRRLWAATARDLQQAAVAPTATTVKSSITPALGHIA
jgi:hypothetical protein